MSVALIDQDCLNNKKDFFYDLDIMKLASYYKSQKEITKLLLLPSEYTQYTKTYFIKNRFDYKMMDQLFRDDRITYRGYAFSAQEYEPLPDDIERAQADISIYDTYLKFNDQMAAREIARLVTSTMENACHARLSMDNVTCNTPQKHIIYRDSEALCLYDYNIFGLSDWYDATQDYKKHLLRLRFPPITSDFEDIRKLLTEYKVYSENHLIFSSTLDDYMLQEVIDLGSKYKDRIRIQILKDLNPYDPEDVKEKVIYALNTILALKQARTRIHTYVDPHDIDQRTAYLNNISYWCNRNHSDSSFQYFMHNIRKTALKKIDELALSDERIHYLYNVDPSKWERRY